MLLHPPALLGGHLPWQERKLGVLEIGLGGFVDPGVPQLAPLAGFAIIRAAHRTPADFADNRTPSADKARTTVASSTLVSPLSAR